MTIDELPPPPVFAPGIRRAPDRGCTLSPRQTVLALKNALRYVPAGSARGGGSRVPGGTAGAGPHLRVPVPAEAGGGRRGRSTATSRPGRSISTAGILEARALQLNIDNNLDFDVALYPYELVTYGETGQVFQNWMQYRLVKQYLEQMTETQTLVVASGHPVGLFPSHRDAPRVINTNGLMVGEFDNPADFHEAAQLGVANYGQMTAGGWMYIGPQGIVHGTYLTLLNAGRLYLGIPQDRDLAGVLYVSSGLGGMSGAQPKAADIAGAVSITAEVDLSRIETRREQGWVQRVTADLGQAFSWAAAARAARTPLSIAYHGNVVDLWQYAVDHEIPVELASDQTSCHAAYEGGYVPQGLDFAASRELLAADPAEYRRRVDASLRRQIELIGVMAAPRHPFLGLRQQLPQGRVRSGRPRGGGQRRRHQGRLHLPLVRGAHHGAALLRPRLRSRSAGSARAWTPPTWRAPTQVAMTCIDPERCWQDRDNYNWVRDAGKNKLVVGSQARILYSDAEGRVRIALAFNDLVRRGRDRAGHHRPGPPRRVRHRLALPGDQQHPRRVERDGRHGLPLLGRQRRPGDDPGRRLQRRAEWASAGRSTPASAWCWTARPGWTASSGRRWSGT